MVALLALVVLLQTSYLKPQHETFSAKWGKHTAKLTLRTKVFDPKAHKLEGVNGRTVKKIDGIENPFGGDYSMPFTEFDSVALEIDGKRVEVPLRLFSDCFNPKLNVFHLTFSDDKEAVFAFMQGGSDAGTYEVIWCLRRDAKHTRYARRSIDRTSFDMQAIYEADQDLK